MIEDLGISDVTIEELELGDSFGERLSDPRAAELAKDIERNGLLQFPMIRASDRQVIFGSTRVAAHMILGKNRVRVRKVQCSDLEVEILRRAENAFRRHDSAERSRAARELVSLLEYQVKEERERAAAEAPEPRKKGRPKSVKTEARERAAAALGTSAEALRKAEEREGEEAFELDGYGWAVPDDVKVAAAYVHEAASAVDRQLRKLQAVVTSVAESLPTAHFQKLHSALHEAASLARAVTPYKLCPVCLANELQRPACKQCYGVGYVSEEAWERVPESLRQPVGRRKGAPPPASFVEDSYENEEEPPLEPEEDSHMCSPDVLNEVFVYDDEDDDGAEF